MKKGIVWIVLVSLCVMGLLSCLGEPAEREEPAKVQQQTESTSCWEQFSWTEDFKVPLEEGLDWQIDQSWSTHCMECDEDYPPDSRYPHSFCDPEHSTHMGEWSEYGWDFNLPDGSDRHRHALAAGDGCVEFAGDTEGDWGYVVIINHGNNLCTRYGHLDAALSVSEGQYVCQGLRLGEIGGTPHWPEHLHFQFENCDDQKPISRGFSDGNGIPICIRGDDLYNADGNYSALKWTNKARNSCSADPAAYGEGSEVPFYELWDDNQEIGFPSDCPLNPHCTRRTHTFVDQHDLVPRTAEAAAYLWRECAIDGKEDGGLHPEDLITRAEGLKVALFLYGVIYECGEEEASHFVDVAPEDWFFPIVACALRHGVISDFNQYFDPQAELTFAEGAKMLVEVAVRRGAIRIRDDGDGENFPEIPWTHWAYGYAETLYYYGGLPKPAYLIHPDDRLSRQDFIMMAAALSPCFCRNVRCQDGTVCEQLLLACVDPAETDRNDIGGGGGPDEHDYRDDDRDDEREDRAEPWQGELAVGCWIEREDSECQDGHLLADVECEVRNVGDQVLKLRNLRAELAEGRDARHCELVDADLRSGVGYWRMEPGESGSRGGYQLYCQSRPSDGLVDLRFELVERSDSEDRLHQAIAEAEVLIEESVFENCCVPYSCQELGYDCGDFFSDGCGGRLDCGDCEEGLLCGRGGQLGQCVADPDFQRCEECSETARCINGLCVFDHDWICDPATGFQVRMEIGAGSTYHGDDIGPNDILRTVSRDEIRNLRFNCHELPGVLRVEAQGHVRLTTFGTDGDEDFAVWRSFREATTLDPRSAPDLNVSRFEVEGEETILMRVPPLPVLECRPETCNSLRQECGRFQDGCGGWLDCGECPEEDPPEEEWECDEETGFVLRLRISQGTHYYGADMTPGTAERTAPRHETRDLTFSCGDLPGALLVEASGWNNEVFATSGTGGSKTFAVVQPFFDDFTIFPDQAGVESERLELFDGDRVLILLPPR